MRYYGKKPIKDYIPWFLHTAAGAFILVLLFVDRKSLSVSTLLLAAYVGGSVGCLVYLLRTKEPTETFSLSDIFAVLLMTLPMLPAWGLGGMMALLFK